MKIELDVFSSNTQMQRITDALRELLEDERICTADIGTDEPMIDADVHLVCFDIRKHACPFLVIEWIERLEGKEILLIGFSALGGIEGYPRRIESQILPFLPDDCDYKGMYLCPSTMNDEELAYLEKQMVQNGKRENISKIHQMYEDSLSHPDEGDILEVVQYVREKLVKDEA